jgi:AraC-like DNA-binding protein
MYQQNYLIGGLSVIPHARFLATDDQNNFQSPDGWDFSIYSFDPQNFWYSKTSLPVFRGCEIVRYDFRGKVRFRAGLKTKCLQIHFIDSYSNRETRLQGIRKIDSIMMITIGGYDWDGVSDVGAFGIEINFDEDTTNKIITDEHLYHLGHMANLFGSKRAIVTRPSPAAMALRQMASQYLAKLDQTHSLIYNNTELINIDNNLDISQTYDNETAINEDAFIEIAKNTIDETVYEPPWISEFSNMSRRNVALTIERLLWQTPQNRQSDDDYSLDEFAALLKVSRRTIQIAVQEQFGVGFIALRRLIRLHQIRMAIRSGGGRQKINVLARTHYMDHLSRLSIEYRQLFGKLPSQEMNTKSKI